MPPNLIECLPFNHVAAAAERARRLIEIPEGVLPLIANVRRAIRPGEQERGVKPGTSAASGGHLEPQLCAQWAGDELTLSITRVTGVTAAEFADDRTRPDPGPSAGESRGLRLTVEQTQIRQAGAPVAAGALERERIRIAPLPAHPGEQRIAAGQLVIHSHVRAIAIALLRNDLAVGSVAAGGKIRLVREWIEEVDDASRRGVDAIGRDAVARELHTGDRGLARRSYSPRNSPLRIAAVGTMAWAPPPSDFSLLPS